jgi:hypothetical protein
MRGRLWVLDAGTLTCWPKVVVFDLRRNVEVRYTKLGRSQQRENMGENATLRGISVGTRMERGNSM